VFATAELLVKLTVNCHFTLASSSCTKIVHNVDSLQHKSTISTKPAFEKLAKIQRLYIQLCGHRTFMHSTPAFTMTIIDKITIFYNDVNKTKVGSESANQRQTFNKSDPGLQSGLSG